MRKGQTIKKTIEEGVYFFHLFRTIISSYLVIFDVILAKQLLGNSANLTDVDSARQLRKRTAPPPKPPAPKRVHKKGAGRPPKKAKANNNTASATNASNAATTQPAADGAATVA